MTGFRWMSQWVGVVSMSVTIAGVATPTRALGQVGDSTHVVPIVLDSIKGTPVRTATYVRTATPKGDLLVLNDLDMSTGVVLGVRAADGTSALEVNLYKNGIPEPVRRGSATDGSYLFEFKTYGEAGIEVKAAAPTEYFLTASAIPVSESPLPSPFSGRPGTTTSAEEASAGARTGDGASRTTVVLGALLLLAVGGLAFVLGRRRGTSTARCLMATIGLAASASALQAQSPWAPDGVTDLDRYLREAYMFQPGRRSPSDPIYGNLGPDGKLLNTTSGAPGRGKPLDGGRAEQIVNLLQQLLTFAGKLGDLSKLGPYDRDYEPDLAPPGMPRVPLRCAEDPDCKACFAPAYGQLNGVRRKLENNRIVLAHYNRRMQTIEDAGRAMGGMHGAAGILFLKNKQEWDAQRASIGGMYDTRYTALMTELQTALRGVEACEAKAYGTTGWYDRFGFMYYEFMAARYRRTGGGF